MAIDVKHLKTFIVVAEELHFGRAAARLHMAQPPVSNLIKQLETELGVELLERTTRTVHLTNPGEVYLEHARRVVADLNRGRDLALEALAGDRGRLRVGLTGVTAVRLLSRHAREFAVRYPLVQIDLAGERFSGVNQTALHHRSIDIAFVLQRVAPGGLSWRKIHDEPLVVVLPDDHVLADQDQVEAAQLATEKFIAFPPGRGSHLRDILVDLCHEAGFRPKIVREASPTHMVLALVSTQAGITVMPASVQQMEVEGIVFRPIAGQENGVHSIMAWRTDNSSPVLRRFLDVSEELFPAVTVTT
ncbi:LysR substrate-binding domain-containing protein [Blastococcus sp. SYSU DS1024]